MGAPRRIRIVVGGHDWTPPPTPDDAAWPGAQPSPPRGYRHPPATWTDDLPQPPAPPPPGPPGALAGPRPRQRAFRRIRCVVGQHEWPQTRAGVVEEARLPAVARYRPRRFRQQAWQAAELAQGGAVSASGSTSCQAVASGSASTIRRVSGATVVQAFAVAVESLRTSGLTQLVLPDPPDWAARLVALFPQGWAGDVARAAGGVLWSLCQAIGTQLTAVAGALAYAKATCRLLTAEDVALDTWSQDLFGTSLPRAPGETDDAFREALRAALFVARATRPALARALTALTGTPPRLLEPWNPGDTCAWDVSYVDVDVAQSPARWGDPSLRYQGAVLSALPAYTTTGGQPAYGLGGGPGWNSGALAWWTPPTGWARTATSVQQVITSTIAAGTLVGLQIASPDDLTRTIPPFRLGQGLLGQSPLG